MKFKKISPGSKTDPKTILIIIAAQSDCAPIILGVHLCVSVRKEHPQILYPWAEGGFRYMLKTRGPGDFGGNSREENLCGALG